MKFQSDGVSLDLPVYDIEKLKLDPQINNGRPYQQCAMSVMDTIADPNIRFDSNGVCNYYADYKKLEQSEVFNGEKGRKKLAEVVNKIKEAGKGQEYDCILGLSGGADSSYMAYLAKEQGLRPLVVHFDYGWNLELAVNNIENIIQKLGFNLYTIVMDWEEMKSLQRAYYKSSVLDLDVPADHMIFGALYETANKFKIKYILSGKNIVTEAVLPKAWNYNKFDLVNLKNINSKFGDQKIQQLPSLGIWHLGYYTAVKRIQMVEILNYIEYNKFEVKELIKKELNWRDYGGKHYENIYTRFYQSYVLPVKFGIDKRKAHLSNLIFSGQLSKEEALQEMSKLPYIEGQVLEDFEYVSKKLGFSPKEFLQLIVQPNIDHSFYGTDERQRRLYWKMMNMAGPLSTIFYKAKILKR